MAAPPWVSAGQMETPELVSLIFLHSRDVGMGKSPKLDKEVWGQKVSQHVGHGKGTSKIKRRKCSKIRKQTAMENV